MALLKDISRFERPSPGPWSYEQQDLGFNYRMSDLQAALGTSQLKRLDSIVDERHFYLVNINLYLLMPIVLARSPIMYVLLSGSCDSPCWDSSPTHHRYVLNFYDQLA